MHEQKPDLIEFVGFDDLIPSLGTRRALYIQIEDGRLPQPLNPYGRRRMWPKTEILEIQRAILLGYSQDQIKQLVVEITERRKELAESLIAPAQTQGAA
ncbi:hypothetical protein LQM11_003087 [Vibrio parahaemolyticus]|nr:hypothetical protein [Vibrio parahaemolyticus]